MAGFLTGIGDVEHHEPAMTASRLQRFCRTFNTLLTAGQRSRVFRHGLNSRRRLGFGGTSDLAGIDPRHREWPLFAHSGRLESTSSGHCKIALRMAQLGGERAYKDRLGKDWSPRQSRHSVRGWRSIRASSPRPWRGIGPGAGGRCGLPRHVGNMLCDSGRDQQIRLSCDQRSS